MAVTVYRSTDPSAPVLSGTAGALVAVLDACLRTGYGSKTGAGWTKPFTGTNAASFKQGGGNGFYLDVNDNTGGPTEAWLRGYEVETAVATGTGPFPTVAQITNGIFHRKSSAADATPVVWTLIADDRTFYLFNQLPGGGGVWFCFGFGDFYSYLAGTDGFRTFIMGRAVTGSTNTSERADTQTDLNGAAVVGHYVARSYTGLGGSLAISKQGDQSKSIAAAGAQILIGAMALPNPVDGRVWIAPVSISQPATAVRGKLRGFMHWLHTVASFADQDTVTGTGVYAGRTFLLFKTTGNAGAYCIDITGPWDAN